MKLLAAILMLFIGSGGLLSQPVSFHHLDTDDGLSQGHVNHMLKDSRGFIWVATQDGLNRFDGYSFRQFVHDPSDVNSLSGNYVWCLLEASDGKLWAGTFGKGLSVFDPVSETFETLNPVPLDESTTAPNSIRTLTEHPQGTVWVGTDDGLWVYDLAKGQFKAFDPGIYHRAFINILDVFPFGENAVLLSSGTGLYHLSLDSGELDSLDLGVSGLSCHEVAQAKNGQLLVATSKGLFMCNLLEKEGHASIGNCEVLLTDDYVSCLMPGHANEKWVGTNQGLVSLDFAAQPPSLKRWRIDPQMPGSLSSDIVTCLLEVQPGLVWAGTRQGINQFSIEPPVFQNLRGSKGQLQLCSDAVLGVAEDGKNNLWVATRKGLTRIGNFHLPKEKWTFDCLLPQQEPTMPYDYVLKVKQDRAGQLWALFRRNGFAALNQRPDGSWFFRRPAFTEGEMPPEMGLNDLELDADGVYWLSTPGIGLHSWNPASGEYRQYRSAENDSLTLRHDYVFGTFHDSRQRFWVATANGGLCLMDKARGTFTCHTSEEGNPSSISSNMVLSVFEDSQQRLWACTANGLSLMLPDGRFRRFYRRDGLPNDVIYGMLEDSDGALWVSTNAGLAKLQLADSSLIVEVYDRGDGIQGNEFNQHAFLETSDGRLCFGGVNGLTVFDPKQVKPYPHPPIVAFTGFQLFNHPVVPGKEVYGFRLAAAIDELDKIVLRHNQNFIALEFAALSYADPASNEYAFFLEGLEEDWVQAGKRRFVSYPGLAPGTYTFHVKASNHDGIWSEMPRSLRITVLPPWWNTWWAWMAYTLLAAGMVYFFLRQREATVRRVEAAKSAERESMRKRMARDFHDEAGNRITKLALMTEVLKRSQKVDANLVEDIQSNIQELRSGMRDFIWVLNPENDNLQETFFRLRDAANSVFEHSDISLSLGTLSKKAEAIALDGNQRRHIMMLFKEACSNCVRHSGASEAELAIDILEDHFEIWLRDNGRGFNTQEAESGNGLKNMQVRAKKAGGILRIESNEGAGTRIAFRSQFTQTGN